MQVWVSGCARNIWYNYDLDSALIRESRPSEMARGHDRAGSFNYITTRDVNRKL